MRSGSNEVLTEMNILPGITVEMNGRMDEMASSAEQIDAAVQSVKKITQDTRDGIIQITSEVVKFKV